MNSLQVVRLVISRELHVRMRSRPFIISTVVIWLLVGGLVVAASLSDRDEGRQETVRFGLIGSAADRAPAMGEVAAALDLELVIKGFQSLPAADVALVEGRVDAVLTGFDVLRFAHELDPRLALIANQAVRAERLPERIDELGLTEEQAAGLLRPEPLSEVGLLDPGDDDSRDRAIIAYGPVLLLGAIVFAGQLLLLGVIEEKSSRVVEVLLATLRPAELLFGKVIAILALALFQMVSIGVIGGGLAVAVMDVELPDISIVGVVSVVPWFLMGFLFYGTAFAAVGATVSRQEDASAALMPLMIVMIGSELASIIMIGKEGPVAILALVPFTAPMAMPSLIALGDVGPWLVAASVLVMLASTAGMLWLGARLYAGAVLRTGPRISILDAWRSREVT